MTTATSNGVTCRDVALLALDLGLSPGYPRHDGSKRPDGRWKKYQSTPASREEVERWYADGATGVGLFTGYSKLELLEFDDRPIYERFKQAAIRFGLGDLVGRIEAGYLETTPAGGVHWLYRCEAVEGNTKLAERPAATCKDPHGREPLIETRGVGGWVVIAPSNGSVHPTGLAYERTAGGLETIVTITPDERAALFALARSFDEITAAPKGPPRPKGRPTQSRRDGVTPLDDFNARADHRVVLEGFGWKEVHKSGEVEYWRRPGKDESWSATWGHTKGFRVFTSSTALAAESHTLANVYCVLKHDGDWTACVKDLVRQGYGTWIDGQGEEHRNPPPLPSQQGGGTKPDRRKAGGEQPFSATITTMAGVPRSCVTNAMQWLKRTGPRLEYDTFRDRILVDGETLRDAHIVGLMSAMEVEWATVVNKAHVDDAIHTLAWENAFSSLERYLESLVWDGEPRIEQFFVDHCDVEDTPYHREVGRVFFLSGAARGLSPGIKVDTLPILISPQGSGKSETAKALCPDPEWFTDELGNIGADRAGENLRGKWIVEAAELSRVNQGTLEAVKKFITCQRDRYKVPYEREPRDFPRTNVFVGSTNDDTPLRDLENRRFHPVRAPGRTPEEKEKAIAAIRAIRDQLWAEAVHRYKEGEKWWTVDSEVGAKVAEEVGAARQADPWEDILAERLEHVNDTTLKDAAALLNVTTDKLDRKTEMRISSSLKLIGFERKQRPRPSRAWYYARVVTNP
jgi:hypothetical protein